MLNILIRDIKTTLTDRQALIILIMMPIVLMTILGMALSGVFESDTPISASEVALVYDYQASSPQDVLAGSLANNVLSDTQISDIADAAPTDFKALLKDNFLDNEDLADLVHYRELDQATAREALKRGDLDGVVIFDQAFYDAYIMNQLTPFKNKAVIHVLTNSNNYIKRDIIVQLFSSFAEVTNKMWRSKNYIVSKAIASSNQLTTLDSSVFDTLFNNIEDNYVQIEERDIPGKPTINARAYYAAAMMAMFLLFTAGHGSRLLLDEKNEQTLQRLYMTGTAKWKIFASKWLLLILLGALQCTAMVAYASFVLGVKWGNIATLAVLALAAIITIAALGLLLASYTLKSGNYKLANLLESFIFQIMAFLGGSFLPLLGMPQFIQSLSQWMVNGVALRGMLDIMQGATVQDIMPHLMRLALLAILFGAVGIVIFSRGGISHDERHQASVQTAQE